MQFIGSKPTVGVLYDGALGYRLDAALGLAVLYGLDGKNECRVVALSVPSNNLHAAAFTEIIGRFYAGAVNGSFGAIGRTLPVGMATGKQEEDSPMLKAVLGNPAYAHGINHLNDTADPRAMLRNALTGQHDQNAVVVLAGPATNLAALLDLPGGETLGGEQGPAAGVGAGCLGLARAAQGASGVAVADSGGGQRCGRGRQVSGRGH